MTSSPWVLLIFVLAAPPAPEPPRADGVLQHAELRGEGTYLPERYKTDADCVAAAKRKLPPNGSWWWCVRDAEPADAPFSSGGGPLTPVVKGTRP